MRMVGESEPKRTPRPTLEKRGWGTRRGRDHGSLPVRECRRADIFAVPAIFVAHPFRCEGVRSRSNRGVVGKTLRPERPELHVRGLAANRIH